MWVDYRHINLEFAQLGTIVAQEQLHQHYVPQAIIVPLVRFLTPHNHVPKVTFVHLELQVAPAFHVLHLIIAIKVLLLLPFVLVVVIVLVEPVLQLLVSLARVVQPGAHVISLEILLVYCQ